jgi:hypothetical protein
MPNIKLNVAANQRQGHRDHTVPESEIVHWATPRVRWLSVNRSAFENCKGQNSPWEEYAAQLVTLYFLTVLSRTLASLLLLK